MAESELGNSRTADLNSAKVWLDQLTSEYRIIQDKIDKIAGFRFTIRGWSVTLVVALAFGANTLKLPPYWILSAFLPVVSFLLMEYCQGRYSHVLSQRAIRIEKRIWRILRLSALGESEVAIGGMVPRLAHDLGEADQLSNPKIRWLRSTGYFFFYGTQMVLVAAATLWLSEAPRTAPEQERPSQVVIDNSVMNTIPEATGATKGEPHGKTRADHRRP